MIRRWARPPKPCEVTASSGSIRKAVDAAQRADAVVLSLGELALMSGELSSRSSLALPGHQQELMEAVVPTGQRLALVLMSGRPLSIGWAVSHVPAILQASYRGSEGGYAIADLLFGEANPASKLLVTWPRWAEQAPQFLAANMTHQPEG